MSASTWTRIDYDLMKELADALAAWSAAASDATTAAVSRALKRYTTHQALFPRADGPKLRVPAALRDMFKGDPHGDALNELLDEATHYVSAMEDVHAGDIEISAELRSIRRAQAQAMEGDVSGAARTLSSHGFATLQPGGLAGNPTTRRCTPCAPSSTTPWRHRTRRSSPSTRHSSRASSAT
jgi:hypothetical protein